jgi:hypothetical protein
MRHRRFFALCAAALTLSFGVAACGSDSDDLARKIDAAQVGEAGVAAGITNTGADERKVNADADQIAAEQAIKRRKELAALDASQDAETKKLEKEGVPGGNDGDTSIPIGSADPDEQAFRAKLAGVCSGGQSRIQKAGIKASSAAKSKDPKKVLEAAQAYSSALDDFTNALHELDPPKSMETDYSGWLQTIDDLSSTVRLQLVSTSDPAATKRLQTRLTKLTTQLIEQSAKLGVTCLSAT